MKKILYILFLFPVMVLAQTTTQNFVKTSVYREATGTSDASKAQASVTYVDGLGRPIQQVAGKASATGKDIVTHIEYDRYNRTQREYLPYPVTTANLSFTDGAKAGIFNYYASATDIEHTTNPYSRTMYEASPLNRVLKTTAPGNPWAMDTVANKDRSIKYAYLTNTYRAENPTFDNVRKLSVTAVFDLATGVYNHSNFTNEGMYPAGQLYKTITQDENKTGTIYTENALPLKLNTTEEFKNKQGQLLLKRTYRKVGTTYEALNTYYIYDQFGNLSFVSSPMGSGSMSTSNRERYTYQYKYDARNRLVEKKLPGKQWEYIVYDSQDRVVATGPALSPFGSPGSTPEQGWLITRYDAFGRVAYTGWLSSGTTAFTPAIRKTMQDAAVALAVKGSSATIDGISVNYTNALPTGTKLLTVNYYDDYNFPGLPTPPSGSIEGQVLLTNCKGLATASWVRVLNAPTETYGETTYTFYDRKSRPVRTRSINYLGGYTETDTKMDFDGTPQYTITRHKRVAADAELVTREDFTYTPEDRLLSHTHKINSLNPELMAKNEYTELGQLKNKKVGGADLTAGTFYQKVDYSYNVRGWLTAINDINGRAVAGVPDDLFTYKINYNTIEDPITGVQPLFNGNISETYWRSSGDDVLRKYSYGYDNLNRLLDAWYQKPEGTEPNAGSYNEHLQYDKNGNIVALQRNGDLDNASFNIEIDNLAYTYTGNRLDKVDDSITNNPKGFTDGTNTDNDYTYDANGNMIGDKNKGITLVTYNHLNLPTEIIFNNNSNTKINYLYNAAGVKLKKTVTASITRIIVTDYLGGFQYVGGQLDFMPTAEGYVKCLPPRATGETGSFSYVYQYKDHLGNVRLNYAWDNVANGLTVLNESHYYPFGLKHEKYNTEEYEFVNGIPTGVVLAPLTGGSSYKYKYLGQERQDELGLNWDTFRHRNYDYAIGRFMCIDPIAEEYMSISTYQFAHNNPVWKIELEGLEGQETQGEDQINREPIKVKQARVGGGLGPPVIYQKTAEKATKSTVQKLIGKLKSAAKAGAKFVGTGAALLGDYMSPDYGGRTDEMKMTVGHKIQGETVVPTIKTTPYNAPEEKQDDGEIIYRGGDFNNGNFTPRPGIDDKTGPKSGLSTFTNPLKAVTDGAGNIIRDKAQGLSSNLLEGMGFQLTKVGDHVGIRPPSQTLLEKWAQTKGLPPGSDPAQILTEMVKSARVIELKF